MEPQAVHVGSSKFLLEIVNVLVPRFTGSLPGARPRNPGKKPPGRGTAHRLVQASPYRWPALPRIIRNGQCHSLGATWRLHPMINRFGRLVKPQTHPGLLDEDKSG